MEHQQYSIVYPQLRAVHVGLHGFVNLTSLHVKDCAWTAAAPHQTSKLSPNTALVSLPPLLHTLLKPKCPAAFFFFFNPPLPPFWSHLSSKATALLLLGGICEKHDAVKLMLKELSGCKKMRRLKVCVCVCVPEETNSRGKFIWAVAPRNPSSSLPLTMHIKCMTRSEEEF